MDCLCGNPANLFSFFLSIRTSNNERKPFLTPNTIQNTSKSVSILGCYDAKLNEVEGTGTQMFAVILFYFGEMHSMHLSRWVWACILVVYGCASLLIIVHPIVTQ